MVSLRVVGKGSGCSHGDTLAHRRQMRGYHEGFACGNLWRGCSHRRSGPRMALVMRVENVVQRRVQMPYCETLNLRMGDVQEDRGSDDGK